MSHLQLSSLVVAAALAALALTVAWALTRRTPPIPKTQKKLVCPTCHRLFALGNRYCPDDATPLCSRKVAANLGENSLAKGPAKGSACPRCRRRYRDDERFCPFDAEPLIALSSFDAVDSFEHLAHHLYGIDKICPVCAAKYGLAASFCGRDGSALVSVN